MEYEDILKGAFARAREREATKQAEPAETQPEEGKRGPGRDADGRVIRKSEAPEPESQARPQSSEERAAEIKAELAQLRRDRGLAPASQGNRRMAKLIASYVTL